MLNTSPLNTITLNSTLETLNEITASADIISETTRSLSAQAIIVYHITQAIATQADIISETTHAVSVSADIFNETTQTITAGNSIQVNRLRTISVGGLIFNPDLRRVDVSIKCGAMILPSTDEITALTATTRTVSSKIEVQWDGITWYDETDRLVNAQGDEKMDTSIAETIASTADFEMDNTDSRFTPNNYSSEVYPYLKPRTPIRYSISINGTETVMFTGLITAIKPNRNNGTVTFNCIDNSVLINEAVPPRESYVDKYAHELMEIVALNAGLTSEQLEIETSHHLVRGAFFGGTGESVDTTTGKILSDLASAERGRAFFNRRGLLSFWGRDHIQNQCSLITLDTTNHVLDYDNGVSESNVKNKVSVVATPRASAGIQVVWTNGDARTMNQYTDSLVWMPADGTIASDNGDSRSVQSAWLTSEDPISLWIRPVANVDYLANTLVDGTGVDMTSQIEIIEFNPYSDAAFITVRNHATVPIYFTRFQVRANPLKIWKWIKVQQTDDFSIDQYGLQEITIENNYIDDEVMASDIAETELLRNKSAISDTSIDIRGIAFINVGDLITLSTPEINEIKMITGINWKVDQSNGFKESLTLRDRIHFPTTQQISPRANIFGTTLQTVVASATIHKDGTGTKYAFVSASAIIAP